MKKCGHRLFHKPKNKCLQFICSLDLDDDDKDGGEKGNGGGNDDDDEPDEENNGNDPGVGSGERGDGENDNAFTGGEHPDGENHPGVGVENIVMEKMSLKKIFLELRTLCKNLFSKLLNCHEMNIF